MLEVPSSRALNPSQFESEPSPAAAFGVGVLCTPRAELLLTSFLLELPCLSEVGLLSQAQREAFLQLTIKVGAKPAVLKACWTGLLPGVC